MPHPGKEFVDPSWVNILSIDMLQISDGNYSWTLKE
jgi:hypothetical protein